jgi:quercetin dioxygenase-like cupin family protein
MFTTETQRLKIIRSHSQGKRNLTSSSFVLVFCFSPDIYLCALCVSVVKTKKDFYNFLKKIKEEIEMNEERAKIINTEALQKDTKYEPPLVIAWGVDENTTGTKTITMGRTIIPPGGRNQRHYHANCDAAFFVRKGAIKVFIGDEKKEYIAPENHIVYSPKGAIHGLANMSDTETAELIFTYGNCPSKPAAGTVFVEDPWVKK